MTDQELNKRVAELLGWTSLFERYMWGPSLDGVAPGDSESSRKQVPDFCNDHNAVAEMRKAIKGDERNQFARHVCDLAFTGNEDCRAAYYWSAIDATPRQQAEAFVALRGGGK